MTRVLSRHSSAILLSVYAAVCLGVLGLTPLWLDEVLQLGVAWQRPLHELMPWIKINPGAVPLPYLVEQASLALFGHSAFAARLPTLAFSVAAGFIFIAVCDRIGLRYRLIALALFLLSPLQFRYALEARGYSEGLFFTVALLWVFLKFQESASPRLAILYFATVALGLYFHPFVAFVVAAQLLTTIRRSVWIAAAAAGACFVPWLILQHQARAAYVFPALFPVGRVTPLTVLHELTGGGYACTVALLALAGFGLIRARMAAAAHRLLILTAILCIAGPLIADLAFHYFFAGRQFLMAAPALALLAAHGLEPLAERSRPFAAVCLAVFLGVSLVKDYQDATGPKDDLASSASAVAPLLDRDACVITAPGWARDYYGFFRPGVTFTACAEPTQSPEVIAVVSHGAASPPLPSGYVRMSTGSAGRSEVSVWKRTTGN